MRCGKKTETATKKKKLERKKVNIFIFFACTGSSRNFHQLHLSGRRQLIDSRQRLQHTIHTKLMGETKKNQITIQR